MHQESIGTAHVHCGTANYLTGSIYGKLRFLDPQKAKQGLRTTQHTLKL